MWKVLRAVDLSLPLCKQTPVYPGDPAPRVSTAAVVQGQGYHLSRISFGSHAGTHMDAPFHTLPDGVTIDRVDLDCCAGEGVIIPVRGKRANEAITAAELASASHLLQPGVVVLLHTGWDKKAGRDSYFDHPHLEVEACRWLLSRGVKTIGTDTVSLDRPGADDLPNHRLIAEHNGVIVEGLANLDLVDFPNPLIVFFPLSLSGCDGSPVRAAALELAPPPFTLRLA
jgi:kynurenine formamidase